MPIPRSRTEILTYFPAANGGIKPAASSTFSESTSIFPPSGMACKALRAMFSITCRNCPSSASTAQRSGGAENSQGILAPRKADRAASLMISVSCSRLRIGSPPRANITNCWVRPFARRANFSIITRRSSTFSLEWASILARERLPRTPCKILLKSWAIPPAKRPTDSSLLSLSCCASDFCCLVMSRKTTTTPTIPPSRPRIGAAL